MIYKKLGQTDLTISPMIIGTMTFGWHTPQADAFRILDAAVEAGLTTLDTANIYSRWVDGHQGGESETVIGEWLKTRPRDAVQIATKLRGRMWDGPDGEGLGRVHIVRAVEDSLHRLGTDHIDLLQTHWFDADTPLEETLRAFYDLIQSGKVRAIGASNTPAWRMMKALWVSHERVLPRYESLQPHHSLLHRDEFERELADMCLDQHISVIPYSPLAAGFLSGKYTRANRDEQRTNPSLRGTVRRLLDDDRAFDVLDVARGIADDHSATVPQVALAWQMSKPFITAPIIGVRTLDHLTGLLPALELALSDDEIGQLDAISSGF